MTSEQVLELLAKRGALLSGHFRLSSGLHSDRFIQKFRIFEDPPTAEVVCAALAAKLASFAPQVVVSAAVGGVIPGYIVARNLAARDIFVEKEGGVPALRRGFSLLPGERVVIVEDVMTTGKSAGEVSEVVESKGAIVCAIGAIVKRGNVALPYPIVPLLELALTDYTQDACPLCRQGIAIDDPGSRRIA